jgi:hypothetical protein
MDQLFGFERAEQAYVPHSSDNKLADEESEYNEKVVQMHIDRV